jgi:hypothetical protein
MHDDDADMVMLCHFLLEEERRKKKEERRRRRRDWTQVQKQSPGQPQAHVIMPSNGFELRCM